MVITMFQEEDPKDTGLTHLEVIGDNKKVPSWITTITLEKYKIDFKIDTGTDVTPIPEMLYRRMEAPTLQEPKKILKGPG